MGKTQQLQEKASLLPEHLASEVLDFLEFLTAKHAQQHASQVTAISRLRGSFRGRLSSTSEFAARKSDEVRLEE